ncbi:MAG: hypothetical protein ACE5G5_02290 [Candidatus Methylomirabilales bacterium]
MNSSHDKSQPKMAATHRPGIGATVEYTRQAKRKVVARIKSRRDYLVALGVSDWDDFDLT